MGDAAQIMNRPASSKGAVLVLSDSPAVRDPLVGLLHKGNYSVVECTEDESPSDLVSKLRPNLVLIARSGSAPRLERQVRRLLKSSELPPVIVLGSPLEEIDEGDD